MKKKSTHLWLLGIVVLFLFGLSACSSDDDSEKKNPTEEYIKAARKLLNGNVVLHTKATMNGVDKTLLPKGCPTKFNFEWTSSDTLKLSLNGFTVGNMPFTIYFHCLCKCMELNSWEKDEYKGSGWIKFKGKDGQVTGDPKDNSAVEKGSGATVIGYLNVKTQEINFIVNYNMMNVRSECFLQTIDKNLIKHYEEDFKRYEEELAEYKKQHGL